MPTLFACYRSRATRNYWLAAETGMALETKPVIQHYRLSNPQEDRIMHTQSPEFLEISPAGAIPVLQDGELVLAESLAINLYLAKKHGGPLAPSDAAEEAQMVQWALYGMTAIEPHTLPIMYAHVEGRADKEPGITEVATHSEALMRPLKALNTHLEATGHMVGGRFTVADINMAEIVRYAQPHPSLLAQFPAVDRWIKTCQARPAFIAMMEAREAEPAKV